MTYEEKLTAIETIADLAQELEAEIMNNKPDGWILDSLNILSVKISTLTESLHHESQDRERS
jgi:hypothetical protein